MSRKPLAALATVLIAVVAFAAGFRIGGNQAGDRSYGLESTMGWTAASAASAAKAGRLVCPSYRTSSVVNIREGVPKVSAHQPEAEG